MTYLNRRQFLERTTAAGMLVVAGRYQPTPSPAMYVSLNSSLTRQMPWPDFVRLASKLGYGGVDVNFNAAKADGAEATRSLLTSLRLRAAVCNLPVPYASTDEPAYQDAMKQLEKANAVAEIAEFEAVHTKTPAPENSPATEPTVN